MQVRFFFAPASEPFFRTCLEYLVAFRDAAENVRAVMLAGGPLTMPGLTPVITSMFATEIGDDYINVVAAPPHHLAGAPLTTADVVPAPDARDTAGYAMDSQNATRVGEEVVYQPSTILSQYHTAGRVNLALVGPLPDELDQEEYDALKKYDAILASSGSDALELTKHQLRGFHVLPKAESLKRLMEGLC